MSAPGTEEVLQAVRAAVDSTTADRVFGSPVAADGVVLLPVARVAGGGGGGSGAGSSEHEGHPEGSGAGGGFGTSGRGLGVFVVKDGKVAWHPAVDVTRIVLGGQLVAIAALLVVRSVLRARRRHSHPTGRALRKAADAARTKAGRLTR